MDFSLIIPAFIAGVLLLTDKLSVLIAYFYQWFDFIYESLLDYL